MKAETLKPEIVRFQLSSFILLSVAQDFPSPESAITLFTHSGLVRYIGGERYSCDLASARIA
jgi:hypothetical protein